MIQAIEEAIKLQYIYNIKVINLSLGRPIFESYKTDPLCQEVEKAWQKGITVVVAAGNAGRDNSLNNQGYGTIAAPGNDPLVITVGAMNTEGTPQRGDDLMTTYSSRRAHARRQHREARHRCAGEQNILHSGSQRHARNDVPGKYRSSGCV